MEYLHGGDIYGNRPVRLDFSVNLNPLGIPEKVFLAVWDQPEVWSRYPDSECRQLRGALADYYRGQAGEKEKALWRPEQFICGNGASDLLYTLAFALRPRRAVLFSPCFGEYETALQAAGCQIERMRLSEKDNFSLEKISLDKVFQSNPDLLVLGNPNNPTGLALTRTQLKRWAAACRERNCMLLLDECFNWFIPEKERYSAASLLHRFPGIFLLNAFTKIFALAGLRLGYGICSDLAILEKMRRQRQPWSVSGPAQAAGIASLLETEFVKKTSRFVETERAYLRDGLTALGFYVFPSMTNFLLFRSPDKKDYGEMCRQNGILLRSCHTFDGLGKEYYRVCVGKREENKELLRCLGNVRGINLTEEGGEGGAQWQE